MNRIAVCFLFFFSGAAGLVYQVVWVRQFGNVFGNTIHSASVVTAVFMLGLGIGGWLCGVYGDKRYAAQRSSLLSLYAGFELAIGLLGAVVALLLPRIEPLSPLVSSYVRGDDGWLYLSAGSHVARYVLAVVLLLPVTFLMGGTLTLLIRHLVRSNVEAAGWRVGVLYGVNTAGAALGAFLVDFALIPSLGLLATQSVAVVLNLTVSLIAFWLAAREARDPSGSGRAVESGEERFSAPVLGGGISASMGRRLVGLTGTAIFLSGFAAMGMEILWFRFLGSVLGGRRQVFSLLLAVVLVGIWLGATCGGAVQRRFGRAAQLYIMAQGAFVFSALFLLAAYQPHFVPVPEPAALGMTASLLEGSFFELRAGLRPILWVAGLPAFFMGFAYPLANATTQRVESSVGKRAGLLYFANTAGAVMGSLLAGFVLIPALGMQRAIFALASIALAAALPLFFSRSVIRRVEGRTVLFDALSVGTTLFAVASLVIWVGLPADHLARVIFSRTPPDEKILFLSEGPNESIAVTESSKTGARRLSTNGYSMSGTSFRSQRYMRAFVHVPLLQSDAPERVLVICFGVGNTVHAASLHSSVKTLEVVDLSRHVLRQAGCFTKWNRGVLSDPRVVVHINDGRQHLRMQPKEFYDLVTLEPPPITSAGASSLYSREFYELVRQKLRRGGRLTQWLPAYQVPPAISAAMVRSFVEVFPEAVLLSGCQSDFILMGRKTLPLSIDPRRVAKRLEAEPAVLADLRQIEMGTLTELIGAFAGSRTSLANMAAGALPLTDDLPLLEYAYRPSGPRRLSPAMVDPTAVEDWCPHCFEGGAPVAEVADLPVYLRIMSAFYETSDFMESYGGRLRVGNIPAAFRSSFFGVYQRSPHLQRLFEMPGPDQPGRVGYGRDEPGSGRPHAGSASQR